jgi:hypothetical protein
MGTAVAALSWELLARCRWWLALAAGLLILLCLVGLALPESWRSEVLAGWLVAVVALPAWAVVGSMVHAEGARFEDAGSLFPTRFFTLPVPTVVLVAPPLLLGTLLVLVWWLVFAIFILRPWGADVPLFWPGLLAAAILATLQALTWAPFPLPWLRALLLAVVVPGLMAGSVFLNHRGTSPIVITGSALTVLLASYGTALMGVSRSRHGSGVRGWSPVLSAVVAHDRKDRTPFRSPLQAQEWLERQRLFWGFFTLTFTCLVTTLFFMWLTDFLVRDLNPEQVRNDLPELSQALIDLGRSWLALAQLPVLPLLISGAVGAGALGRLSSSAECPQCSPFVAGRPMWTVDMLSAKLRTCARGVIVLWALMFLEGLLWAVCMGRVGELADQLVARMGSAPTALLTLSAAVIILPAVSWLWLVSGMGVRILRWPMLPIVPALFSIAVILLPGLLIAHKMEPWRPVLGGIAAVALVCKALAVYWIVRRLRAARLVHERTIVWALVAWFVLASAVLGVGVGLLGMGRLFAGFAVLLLPLARPLSAPLALARHRTQ